MTSKEERLIRLLQYLKKYTDKDNPTSTALIDYYFDQKGLLDFFGPKSSRRKSRRTLIKELVRVINSDIYGNPLPKKEWRLMYDGYGESEPENNGYIRNLYYVQPFSRKDIEDIRKSIDSNTSLDNEQKETLKAKVTKHLSNENYESHDPFIRRGSDPVKKKKRLTDVAAFNARMRFIIQQKTYYD